ncbi:MAG TPA: flippase [Flavobacteriaceae bacterium]|nr:flippase [Flavobacteriaceae bacterium]
MKEILKGSLIIFIFKIFGAISLFLIYLLIPRYYGIEVFGVFNLIFGILIIGTVFSRMGLDTYILRIISSLDEDAETTSSFLKEVFKILFFSSIFVGLFIVLISEILNTYIFKSIDATNYLLVLALLILPYTFFNILPEVFRGFDDIKIYSFFRNFLQNFLILLFLATSILMSWNYSPIYILYVALFVISVVVILVAVFFLRKRNIQLRQAGKYNKKILIHSYPMFLATSIMFLMSYVDSFMIGYYLDEYQVGIYSACINLSMLITFIPMAIGGFISPKVSKYYSSGEKQKVKDIFKNSLIIIVVVTIPIFMIIYFYAEFFLGLFGKAFIVATTTLLITNIAFLSEALCGPVGFILNMTDNQHIFMKILIIALLINIIFNSLLIPIYGINGAAVAMLLSMLFWTISSFVVLKRKEII